MQNSFMEVKRSSSVVLNLLTLMFDSYGSNNSVIDSVLKMCC